MITAVLWVVALTQELAVPQAPAPQVPRPGQEVVRYAISVGQNESDTPGAGELRYADDDAVEMHRLFTDAGFHSTLLVTADDETVAHYTLDEEIPAAGHVQLAAAFQDVFTRIRRDVEAGRFVEFFFFFSGHGNVEHGEGYVTLEDGRLSRGALRSLLAASPAHVNHVMVDACRSWFLVQDKGRTGRRTAAPAGFSVAEAEDTLDARTGFILSTASDRESHEWERFRGGVFTHELRSALRGAADADGDGSITYAELGAFLRVASSAIDSQVFRPDHLVRPPGRQNYALPVLQWRAGDTLGIDAGFAQHAYVEDAAGNRLVDVHPTAEQSVVLHVPSTRPLFLRLADESGEYEISAPGPQRLDPSSKKAPHWTAKGALNLALLQLFEAPFSGFDVARFQPEPVPEDDKEPGGGGVQRTVTRVLAGAGLAAVPLVGLSVLGGIGALGWWGLLSVSPSFVGLLSSGGVTGTPRYVLLRLPAVGVLVSAFAVAAPASIAVVVGALCGLRAWMDDAG